MVTASLRLSSRHAYQKSLCLPKTKFSNRSNLQKTIDVLIPQCSQQVYQEQFNAFLQHAAALDPPERTKFVQDKLFVLHDGPPYANGDLHLGHALNKILKDFINRFQLLKGKYVYYKTGWDCHGLPIELKALQKLAAGQNRLSASKVRSLAAEHARKTIKSQRNQFEKFAIATNWDDHYETMQRSFELHQLDNLKKMIHTGLIKRQNKPVYWGTETKTALAESELEYKEDHLSISAYVKFPLTTASCFFLQKFCSLDSQKGIDVVIWTTTPWTIFANEAICFNKNLEYGIYDFGDKYVLLQSEFDVQTLSDKPADLVALITGAELAQLKYTSPVMNDVRERPLMHGDHVSQTAGTGLVHTAPGHGFDDYAIGVKNGLPIFSPVDNEGRYRLDVLPDALQENLREPGEVYARKVLSENTTQKVLELLRQCQMLLKSEKYVHSYPYDWRSKKPVIIRATPQWFADLTDVRGLALEGLKNVCFYPERGHTRLASFIKSRTEWCISRQRSWGVPIPAFHKRDNPEEVLMNEETVEHVISVIASKGIDAWFKDDDGDMKEWLLPKYHDVAHLYCRGKDTVDVWFDSGSTWKELEHFYINELGLEKAPTPLADVYLEGSDQHRGWFQSSLLTRVATSNLPQAPYGTLVTHGFTLDENGIKMSKSIGNTVLPESVIKGDEKRGIPALGVDGMRLLIAQADFTTDVVIGPTVTRRVAESLKKLRLTFKFILGNLQQSEHGYKLLDFDNLRSLDQYTLSKLKELNDEALKHYESFNFSKVLTAVMYHMNNHLSAFYFDIVKDSLYADAVGGLKRQQVQTTLFHIFDTYRSILGPILPVMVQEAWNFLPRDWHQDTSTTHGSTPQNSPLLRPWARLQAPVSPEQCQNFEQNELRILELFNQEFKKINGLTKTAQSQATILLRDDTKFPFSADSLADILQVGHLRIKKASSHPGARFKLGTGAEVSLVVEPSELHECPRCWKHNSLTPESLCERCDAVVVR
ncbi:LAME_0H08988g1_1 [Lachancea meyersii CBS 8951]|uniref:isoleucine--tRNA ligase n=1 Tax=Lachancea meyersii CBS 8951 TaxID=1266667 RepID=A0A1G4KFA9_9SACH|nr:LAME_0H08988g1_1 [Lachancea meyersii CBS 8951]